MGALLRDRAVVLGDVSVKNEPNEHPKHSPILGPSLIFKPKGLLQSVTSIGRRYLFGYVAGLNPAVVCRCKTIFLVHFKHSFAPEFSEVSPFGPAHENIVRSS